MFIKGFDKDLKCRGFQFEVGKEYKIDKGDRELRLCADTVFHFCDSLSSVNNYYLCDTEVSNRFCIVEPLGEIIKSEDTYGSDHIKIIREIGKEELLILKGLINGNTGLFNSGSRNSGRHNSGNANTGSYNSGVLNSGDYNSGSLNSGSSNSADYNSGDCNSGSFNSGDFNSCDCSNGIFCNEEDSNIRIFNKPSGMSLSEFRSSIYYRAISSEYLELVKTDTKKKIPYKEACKDWWNRLEKEDQEIIKSIPNFDKEVFYDITGIEID